MAAELAHLQIEVDGRDCPCGKQGCLETYVSHQAVVRQGVQAGLIKGSDAIKFGEVLTALKALANLARSGNAKARKIFEDQGRLLGQWTGNMVNLLAPQLVLLDGDGTIAADLYEPALRKAMTQALTLPHRNRVQLVVRHQGDEVWARGAASLVLQRLDESAAVVQAVSRHGVDLNTDGLSIGRPSSA